MRSCISVSSLFTLAYGVYEDAVLHRGMGHGGKSWSQLTRAVASFSRRIQMQVVGLGGGPEDLTMVET